MRTSIKLVAVGVFGAVAGAAGARVAFARATPAAYLVAEISVKDSATYRQYSDQTPAIVAKFGGRYLVRGGPNKSLEGAPPARRIAIIEFPDMASLNRFEESTEYGAVRPIRQRAATSRLFAVEGVAR